MNRNQHITRLLVAIVVCCASLHIGAAPHRDFVLQRGGTVSVYMPDSSEVVDAAFGMLSDDMQQVMDARLTKTDNESEADIVVETNSEIRHDGFELHMSDGSLHMSASCPRGKAFAMLELSRLMGVSPWVWWANSTPERRNRFVLPGGYHSRQEPAVAYRGIFINDEDWGILPWAGGVIGPDANERIFQLMLRLRANTYWPSMHEVSRPFFTIEGNREMAKKYDIYIGGSHCEPMATSPATEWGLRGVGEYNYATNRDNVLKFWQERVDEVSGQSIVYTLGMRGVHDGAMQGAKTSEDKLRLLQRVIDDQRHMLGNRQCPQVFIPYKEVLDIYRSGLNIPDDVTVMWTDDNYGYIRHFPDSAERQRTGGNGIYYHISYWGRPHDYLWLGTMSPHLVRQQMTEAYHRGVQSMWILNVGDIKPSEYQVEQFLDMAWHGVDTRTDEYANMCEFYKREFGTALCRQLAAVMNEHYRLAFDRKPEHMGGTRTEEADRAKWSRIRAIDNWSTADVAQRVADYQRLSDAVEKIGKRVPEGKRDAYFQLVKYPVQAAAQMNFKFLCPERSAAAYDSIVALTQMYNSNERWNGILDMQPRRLPVFGRVDTVPTYPQPQPQLTLAHYAAWKSVQKGDELTYSFTTRQLQRAGIRTDADSIAVEVRLLPVHPIDGKQLAFTLSVDGSAPVTTNYQTYDRSEEWKQNVLHGYAARRFTLPLHGRKHSLTLHAVTDGVVVEKVLIMNKCE